MESTRQYIVRFNPRTRGHQTRYWTLPVTKLYVEFKRRHRRTGRKLMGMPEVTDAGLDKSTVNIKEARTGRSVAVDERGAQVGLSWMTFRLLDRHQHIRIVSEEDEEVLADFARRRHALQEQLSALAKERREAIEQIWKRSEKVDINELEEKVS